MIRSKFILMFFMMAGLFLACEKDDNEPDPVYEPEMLSFGFYVEDNPGVILEDYVVEDIQDNRIMILMPAEVDRSELIARFTTTENAVVEVDGEVQVSGTTKNDFTVPVDYIVSEETENVKYTVMVGETPDFVWSSLPSYAGDDGKSLVMKVNPENNLPYFLYKQKRESTSDEGAGMLVFKDGDWESLGQVSDGRIGNYFDFTFDFEGNPYVSYADYTTDVSNMLSVKRQDGSSWNTVGEPGFTSDRFSYHSLSFVNEDVLMLAGTFDGRNGPLERRELAVNFYENGNWTINQTIPGRPSDLVGYLVVTVRAGDAVYVGSYNAVNPNTISVHKYENNNWETIIDTWADPEATSISLRSFDIAVDQNENVYVALSDNSSDEEEKHRVIKYDAETGEIENVGNHIIAAKGSYVNFSLAVSPFGVPFLAYRNESLFPTVVQLDPKTQDWTSPEVLESAEVNEMNIDFAANGVGYLSYVKDNVIVAHKFDAPE